MKCNDDDFSHVVSITFYLDEFSLDLDRDIYVFMVVVKTNVRFSFYTILLVYSEGSSFF